VFVVAYYLSEKVAEMLNVKVDEGFYQYTLVPLRKGNGPGVRMQNEYAVAANECTAIRQQKDEEYRKNGDRSALFKELDRDQGQACDRANNAMNKLRSFGMGW
jgi:hypothetical protein